MTKIVVWPISAYESHGVYWPRWGTFSIEEHARNTVGCLKSFRIEVLESLEAFKMYSMIGTFASSLHRESTDSLIHVYIIL